jgi:heat shock protein HtpX
VVSIIAEIVLGVLASIIVMWFSRYREFHADAGGVRACGREKMIDALRALQRVHEPHDLRPASLPPSASPATSATA